jgi:hypothetical protein
MKKTMTRKEKTTKIRAMIARMKDYDRRGDKVLRDQMRRTIDDAAATW